MSEVPRIDFALARNHLVAAHRTVILLPLLRIECVNAVMIRCQSIFQSDPSSQNNLIAVFLAARVSLEAILKKAHVQDFGCRILNSAAAMFPELFKLILMVKIQVAKGSDGFRTEYLGCCTGISKSLFEIPIIGGYAAHSTQQDLGKQGIRWDAGTGRHISFCNALAKGLHCRWLGVFMSICVIFYAIVISGIIDINTMAAVLDERFSVPTVGTGVFFAILTGICIFGGAKRIGHVCEVLAPFMGGAYILGGLLIIVLNISQVPGAIALILEAAFTPRAVTGGAVGSIFIAMRYGCARGIFSNEAGVGSAAMVHCNATVQHPMEQAVWGPVEVFLDTVLVCSVSGIAVVMSGLYTDPDLDGARLTMAAFDKLLPGSWGGLITLGAVLLFGFSCLITFNIYVERGATFVFGEKVRPLIRILWVICVFVGAISGESVVWDIADTVNGIIIFPNLIALWVLSKELVAMKKEWTDPDMLRYKAEKEARRMAKK